MSSTATLDDTSSSSPESLDLDYDDWEGQFEFVGPSVSQPASDRNRNSSNQDDDLNLSHFVPQPNHQHQQSVLFDEETFLSLNLNDFDDCGPPSELFIEDCATLLKKSNRDSFRNNNGCRKFVSAKYHAEELNNIKNRLLADEISNMKGMKTNQQNNNNTNLNNELAADLCDNLTEQVGVQNYPQIVIFLYQRIFRMFLFND